MAAEQPTAENQEARKIQSWQEVLGLFHEHVTTLHGKALEPFIGIIESLMQRGIAKDFFALQSGGRLGVSLSEAWPRPHVMATLNQSGDIEVELCHQDLQRYEVLRKQVCRPSEAADVIAEFAKLLA
jgi:hypothetical protein